MSQPSPAAVSIQSELLGSVDEILTTLRAVASGDLSRRLDLKFPESHPVGALAASVNSMMEALAEAREVTGRYLEELTQRLEMIERQREAIRSLSTPIIELWSGVLCAPIVGVFDSMRASDLMNTLLQAVVDKKAHHVIIDVTGIDVMDTQSADHFLRLARAVTLLGAHCALSGVHPNIARTIVHMGVDLRGLKSYRSMRDALKQFVREVHVTTRSDDRGGRKQKVRVS